MSEYFAQRRPDGSFIINNGTYHIPNEGQWIKQWNEINAQWMEHPEFFEQLVNPEPIPPTLEDQYAAKVAEIISGSNSYAGQVKARYSALEVDSWSLQQAQAETVLAGGTLPDDALLTVLAAANGVSVQSFARRIMANVTKAETITKSIVAQQQAYETQLKAIMADETTDSAAKIEAIQGIAVAYTLPVLEE